MFETQAHVTILQSDSENKDSKTERLTQSNAHLQRLNDGLQSTLTSNEAKLAEAESEVATLKESERNLLDYKESAVARIEELQTALTESEKQMGETKANTFCLQEEKLALVKSNKDLAERVVMLSSNIEDLNCIVEEKSGKIEAISENNDKLLSEIASLKEQYADSNAKSGSIINDMRSQLKEANDSKAELEANLGTAAVANDTLIKKVDELTEEVDTIKSEKQRLTDTVDDMTKQLSSVGAEKAKWQALLNEVVSANNKLGKKIEHNKKKIASLADELGKMAGVKADLESMLQEKEQQVGNIDKELRATRSGLKDIASQLQDSNARAKKFEVEYKAGLEQKELLELVIIQKDKVATDLLEALNEVMATSTDRDEDYEELSAENETLSAKLDEASAKIHRLNSKIKELRGERNTAVSRMQGLLSGNSSLLESKVKDVSARLDSEVAEMQKKVESLEADVFDLQSKNHVLVRENEQLQDDNKEAARQIAALEKRFVKKVTFSATAHASDVTDALSVGASSSASSAFFDPAVVEQVSKAIEWAKQQKK